MRGATMLIKYIWSGSFAFFGGHCRRIGVVALSVMTQQRARRCATLSVVTSLPPCSQTRRIGILLLLPCVPLFHPLLDGAQTFLVGCCVFHRWRSYQCLFYLILNIYYLIFFPPFDFTPSKSDGISLPVCLPLVEPPLHPPLRSGHLLLVGCCVCCCRSAAV